MHFHWSKIGFILGLTLVCSMSKCLVKLFPKCLLLCKVTLLVSLIFVCVSSLWLSVILWLDPRIALLKTWPLALRSWNMFSFPAVRNMSFCQIVCWCSIAKVYFDVQNVHLERFLLNEMWHWSNAMVYGRLYWIWVIDTWLLKS